MSDSSRKSIASSPFADKVCGGNIFAKDDPRHQLFETNARCEAEEIAAFDAKHFERLAKEHLKGGPAEAAKWFIDGVVGRFDISAKYLLLIPQKGGEPDISFESALTRSMEERISSALQNPELNQLVSRDVDLGRYFRLNLRVRLQQRTAHWTAEALKRARLARSTGNGSLSAQPQMDNSDASKPIRYGKRCHKIIDEIRKIKNMVLGFQRTVSEIRNEHQEFQVWALVDGLSEEDRDTFNHPRQWGAVVGYAVNLLAKDYGGCSPHTIRDWVKEYRRANPSERKKKSPRDVNPRRNSL